MPKEKEAYRDNLMMLKEAFGDKDIVSLTEVARWMKKDVRTVKRQLQTIIKPVGISVATLARYLS